MTDTPPPFRNTGLPLATSLKSPLPLGTAPLSYGTSGGPVTSVTLPSYSACDSPLGKGSPLLLPRNVRFCTAPSLPTPRRSRHDMHESRSGRGQRENTAGGGKHLLHPFNSYSPTRSLARLPPLPVLTPAALAFPALPPAGSRIGASAAGQVLPPPAPPPSFGASSQVSPPPREENPRLTHATGPSTVTSQERRTRFVSVIDAQSPLPHSIMNYNP